MRLGSAESYFFATSRVYNFKAGKLCELHQHVFVINQNNKICCLSKEALSYRTSCTYGVFKQMRRLMRKCLMRKCAQMRSAALNVVVKNSEVG